MVDQLQITRREQDGWVVLAVAGQVDVATAPELRQALTEAQYGAGRWLALDLDAVEFLDSFGLGVIIGALKRAATHRGELVIICSRPRLMHLFEVTGLDRIIRVAGSLEEHGSAGPSGHE